MVMELNRELQMAQNEESMPDIGRLSLGKKEQSMHQRRTETDGDMIFSTEDTSVQRSGRDP